MLKQLLSHTVLLESVLGVNSRANAIMIIIIIIIKLIEVIDCSQSPIFPCDRRDRARNGGHLDFQSYRGGGRRGL